MSTPGRQQQKKRETSTPAKSAARLQDKLDARLDAQWDAQLDTFESLQPLGGFAQTPTAPLPAYMKGQAALTADPNQRMTGRIDQKMDARLDQTMDARMDQTMDARMDQKRDARLDQTLDARFDQQLDGQLLDPSLANIRRPPMSPALLQLYAQHIATPAIEPAPVIEPSANAINLVQSPAPARSVAPASPAAQAVNLVSPTTSASASAAMPASTQAVALSQPLASAPAGPATAVTLVSPVAPSVATGEAGQITSAVSLDAVSLDAVSLDQQAPGASNTVADAGPPVPVTLVTPVPDTAAEENSANAQADITDEPAAVDEPSATPVDLLAQPEAPAAATPAPPGTGGVRASMGAIRSEVRARTEAIPTGEITAGTEASRRADTLRDRAETAETERVDAVQASATAAIPPVPAELPASVISHDNPVPGIQALLAGVSNRVLPDQVPPTLVRTPGNNLPELGRRPLSPDTLRRLQELDSETPPVTEAEQRQQEALLRMREQLMTVPAPREGEGVVQSLVDIPPPAHPDIPENNRTQISQALARLLANPTGEAQGMVDRGRRAAFVSNVLANNEATSTLGNDTLLTEFADILGVQFDAIREEAGITAGEMDTQVQTYRDEIEQQRLAQEEAAQMSIDDGSAAVAAANQHVSNAIAGARTAMDEHREEVQSSYGGQNQRAAIEGRRDRLIRDINRHIGQQDANYRRAGETRARELDEAEAAQIAAYRYAVQQDEFQLNRNRSQIQLTPAQLAAIPAGADPIPYYIQTQVAASRTWLETTLRRVRAEFRTLKTAAAATTTTNRDATTTAAEDARQQVRDWAEAALGEEMSWLERLIAMVNDWFGAAEASAQAWETVQNQETAVAASGYVDMIAQVQQAANAGITEEQMLARSNLSAEERAIIHAFFNPPAGGTPGDPIAAVAFGIRERVYQQRAGELKSRFESMVLNGNCGVEGMAYVDLLNAVGAAYTPGFSALNIANRLYAAFYPGITGLGTEEEDVFSALAGLNPVQAKAVRVAYQVTRHESLDDALASEMDTDGERNRARGLLEGNRAIADAAALHMAMDETYLGTGWGTERDLIMTTLRNKTPEEVEAIISAYESTYGGNLREQLRGELDDWATLSTHDADMADAYLASNTELADAIAMDQSMHGFTWGYAFNLAYGTNFEAGARDEFTAVTDRIRQEVAQEATRNQWTEAQFQAEMRRRLARVEASYDQRYGYGQSGALRAATDDRFNAGPNRDLVNATLDNDEIRADAARIAAERYDSVVYASDEVITQAVERRYSRALEAARRGRGPALRQEMNTELQRMDNEFFAAHGRYMTGAERYAEQQQLEVRMERNLETLARTTAERDTRRMDNVFAEEYGNAHNETLTQAVTAATSGVSEEHATTALAQGGYLTRYQRFDFAVRGPGTEEEAAQAAMNGATRAEIDEMDARWRREHNGESLRDRALSELSGTNAMDMTVALEGRPMTIEDAIAVERLRVRLEQPTSWAGGFVAQEERGVLDHHLRELEATAARLNRPVLNEADRDARDRALGEFAQAQDVMQGAVEIHRARVSAVTDSIANTASMVVAVAVGALVSFVSAGTATPFAIALIASVASTMTSIGTRMLLMGNQYGHEEFLNDAILGVVDAIVAAATAGLGNRLLGINQIARAAGGGAVRTGIRGVLQSIERRMVALANLFGGVGPLTRRVPASQMLMNLSRGPWYQRLAATVISESVENAVSALPTAVIGAVIDDNNWKGGFQFGNALQGVASQVGMGVGMGLGMSGGMALGGKAFSGIHRAISGPRLGGDVHFTTREHLPTTDAQVNAAREAYLSQPNPDGSPRTAADFDAALGRERQRHLEQFLTANPGKTEADFDANLRSDADIRRAEFTEMHGGRRDFDADVGSEAGNHIGKVDAEQRQRQAYRNELNDAAPAGRQGDFGDVPISVLSPAEFFRLTGRTSGDTAVIMRDGQAHLLVREGASPASVRAEAARLADLTAVGTGGRSRNPGDALPSDLRGRLNVHVDETLPPRTVEVHYETHNGVIIGVWMQVGPGARAVDIQMHANVARSMRRLQGISGQVNVLLNRMRRWVGMNPAPMPGTRAFEARLEMEKLPAIISERAAALRTARTPEEQMRIMLEVENLRSQMDMHAQFINAIETEPGVGYVAAKDLSAAEMQRALNNISDPTTRATLASLSPAERAQLLYHVDLINKVAGAHTNPVARAHAVENVVQLWRKLNDDLHAGDNTLVNRVMGRIADSSHPDVVIGHLEAILTLPFLDPAHQQLIFRDLGYRQTSLPLLDQTTAMHNLIQRKLPDDTTGRLLVSAIGTPDRVGYLNAVTSLTHLVTDNTTLNALANRMNGTATRSAMAPAERMAFIQGINQIASETAKLAANHPNLPHFGALSGQLIQGAMDVHRPGNFLGTAGEAMTLINDLNKYASSPDAVAAQQLNARVDAVLADPTMAPHLGGLVMPVPVAALGTGIPRSSADVIASIHRSVAEHELGRVVALVEHVTKLGIANPTTDGVHMRALMADITTQIRHMDPARLRAMPELLPLYHQLVDRIRDFDNIVNHTHTILPGGRRISDDHYKELRKGTPKQAIRDLVNKGLTPSPTLADPALPGQFITKNVHADHILSMDAMARMKNFELLTQKQQDAVLNFLGNPAGAPIAVYDSSGNFITNIYGNFVGLSESANTSKGPKSYANWTRHESLGIDVNPEFRTAMMAQEARLAGEIQKYIDAFVVANGGTP